MSIRSPAMFTISLVLLPRLPRVIRAVIGSLVYMLLLEPYLDIYQLGTYNTPTEYQESLKLAENYLKPTTIEQ